LGPQQRVEVIWPMSTQGFTLRPIELLLVFAGGSAGTASRLAVSLLLPQQGPLPVVILLVNLTGALALGWLLTALAARGPETTRRKKLRLLLGTGFMGGFTTYSALATDTMLLFTQGSTAIGLAYGLGTVLLGAFATWVGMLLGTRGRTPQGDAK